MLAQLKVLFRYLLVILFSAAGGALVARGVLTEAQAGVLLADPFIEAAASFAASGAVYLFYLLFSDASKALAAWSEFVEAVNLAEAEQDNADG